MAPFPNGSAFGDTSQKLRQYQQSFIFFSIIFPYKEARGKTKIYKGRMERMEGMYTFLCLVFKIYVPSELSNDVTPL